MNNQLIKNQFNKQAEKFANWSVGRHIEYIKAYCDFCEISGQDKLLDVACGPGELHFIDSPVIQLIQPSPRLRLAKQLLNYTVTQLHSYTIKQHLKSANLLILWIFHRVNKSYFFSFPGSKVNFPKKPAIVSIIISSTLIFYFYFNFFIL
ncbi:hypothetical protein ES705_33096 [subsurface metagenome]